MNASIWKEEALIGQISLWTPAPSREAPARALRRPNGFVILDRAWAARLDVRRVGGVYRIRRRELVERLERLQREEMGRSLSVSWPPTAPAPAAGPATGRGVR